MILNALKLTAHLSVVVEVGGLIEASLARADFIGRLNHARRAKADTLSIYVSAVGVRCANFAQVTISIYNRRIKLDEVVQELRLLIS